MGFRFRKSFKVAPGVKINVSKKSIGISAGTKGAHVSVNSSGRVTKSAGIPGTGISYVETKKINKASKDSTTSEPIDSSQDELLVSPKTETSGQKGIKHKGCLIPLGIVAVLFIIILLTPLTYATGITISCDKSIYDINEKPVFAMELEPDNATATDIKFSTSDKNIAEIIKDDESYILKLNGSEGDVSLSAKNSKGIISNELSITVVDNERIEQEKLEQERLEQERLEQEKLEQERLEAETRAAEEAKASENQQNETVVYVSGSGKKYHSNSSCSGMKSPQELTLTEAESRGYTPCKKCY